MRLWHKDLIEDLPRQQLLGQWREISAIAGNIKKYGSPRNPLVNNIMKYSFSHFVSYTYYIKREMERRGYKPSKEVWDKVTSLSEHYNILPIDVVFNDPAKISNWHDDEYYKICYYNLKEKYNCGLISQEEWVRIDIGCLNRANRQHRGAL